MGKTKIPYSDWAWNVTSGCSHVSRGCENCWAERIFPRLYGKQITDVCMPATLDGPYHVRPRKFNDIRLHYDQLNKLPKRDQKRIFVCSQSDLFHEDVPYKFLDFVHKTILQNFQHTYQILTKRPERALEYYNSYGMKNWYNVRGKILDNDNIHFGVSIEDQKTADERIPFLLQIPAKIRWLSIEPMLEMVDLRAYIHKGLFADPSEIGKFFNPVDWVVVGTESGHNRRPCKIEWIESIVEQCKSANVPVFVKQIHKDGKLITDINQFPKNLRIQEFPK